MNSNASREESIRNAWRTIGDSGIPIYPTRAAVQAVQNLGCDVTAAQPLLDDGERLLQAGRTDELLVVMSKINELISERLTEVRRSEPTSWDRYAGKLPAAPAVPSLKTPIDPETYTDRILGCWLGKCAGTALGGPVEGWPRHLIIREHARIHTYIGTPQLVNDDTAYAPLILHALDEHGVGWTSRQLAHEWLSHLPFAYTAEQSALDNIAAGIMPPESRWFRNPCGAWVGAQMRGEIHGLIAPASPRLAAKFAFRDACISHYREGVDGALYVAAVTSLVIAGVPIHDALVAGLSHVPERSPVTAAVESTLRFCQATEEEEAVAEWITHTYGHYHWIHAIPSLACSIAGFALGKGDFESSLLATIHLGFDTDCTAGWVGALLGASLGASSLPKNWIEPLGDDLLTYVIGFERLPFDTLARWTAKWGRTIVPTVCCPGSAQL